MIRLTIPNALTLVRMVLVPVFVVVYLLPVRWTNEISAAIFLIAAITDWLDGYLARRLKQTSAFGAFLDPVADKIMVAAALVLLTYSIRDLILAIAAIVIVGREIAISALREWMAELGNRGLVAVSKIGKWKTTAQMCAILLLLYREPLGAFDTLTWGKALLAVAAGLTLWSMWVYIKASWHVIADLDKCD
jgi:CDP-diacylglycerol--glycerol-3-phosphate 3-phosphatidyltransferase